MEYHQGMRPFACRIAALLLLSSACNNTPDDPGPITSKPGTTGQVCDAVCGHNQRCAAADAGTYSSSCLQTCTSSAPSASVVSPSAMGFLRDCFTALPCTTDSDECVTQLVTADPSWQEDPTYRQCMTAHAACDAAGDFTFSDDNCTEVFMLNATGRQRYGACFQQSCDQVSSCLDASFQAP